MSDIPGGGTNLGQAIGVVTINTQLSQAQAQINQFAQQTSAAMNQVNASSAAAQASLNAMASAIRGLTGAFGINLGIQGIAQFARAAEEAANVATQYQRQSVAAKGLAGSQAELNDLMAVYHDVTRGTLGPATELENVTKLLSLGFADNTQEIEKFAIAIRGISIATGRTSDDITQRLTLELFSQRGFRLDELGLAYDDVRKASEKLQESDKNLTKQQAYQIAVLDQAIDRYGTLATSQVGAASGIESVHAEIDKLVLAWGTLLKVPIDQAAKLFTLEVETYLAGLDKLGRGFQDFADLYIMTWNALHKLGLPTPTVMTFGTERAIPRLEGLQDTAEGRMKPGAPADLTPENQDKITKAWSDLFDDMQRIEAAANADINEENASYGKRKVEINEQYEQAVADSAATFAKQAARNEEDYQASILEVQQSAQAQQERAAEDHARQMGRMARDHNLALGRMARDHDRDVAMQRTNAAAKEADMAEELDRQIADRRQESAKRLAEIDEDFRRSQADAQRQHYDDLSEAAANLDAKAIYDENRRFAREQAKAKASYEDKVSDEQDKLDEGISNLNEAYDRRLADEQEALDKSIRQSNEAYELQRSDANAAYELQRGDAEAAYALQLGDQQAATAERLEDLKTAYENEKERRNEDQIDRLNQMADHHIQDLDKLDTEHTERIDQIGRHAAEERTERESQHRKDLHELGVANDAWDRASKQHDQLVTYNQGLFYAREEVAAAENMKKRLQLMLLDPTLDPMTRQALTLATQEGGSLDQLIESNNRFIETTQKLIDALPKDPYNLTPNRITPTPGTPNPDTAQAQFVRVVGPAMPASAMMATTGGNVANVSFAQGAIVVYGAPGQSVEALAEIIDQRILRVVTVAAGRM